MSETMLTYQLPNGTHVLIHQTALMEGKADEVVPVLLFEEGHTEQEVSANVEPEVHLWDQNEDCIVHTEEAVEVSSQPQTSMEKVEASTNQIMHNFDQFAEMVMWYKCRICTFITTQKEELVEHLGTQHVQLKLYGTASPVCDKESNATDAVGCGDPVSERLVFLCGQCTHGFSSLYKCKEHMMKDHDMIVHEGDEEPEKIVSKTEPGPSHASKSKVRLPQTTQEESSASRKNGQNTTRIKCSLRGCLYKFRSQKALEIHSACHVAGNPRDFKCCECQLPFERWRTCAVHLWKAHDVDAGLLTCPVCHTYKTASTVSLNNHLMVHGETRAFSCPECGKCFKQAAQLRNHRVMHMDRKVDGLHRWYAVQQCDICFKSYADSKCLKKHIQAVHSKLRPYVCQVCGHASARKAMLQMHLRQHTGEKPHSCSLCEYRTGDHNSLRRHLMRHTGQRPYRCPHCPYSAIQSNSYKNHLCSKHPGQSGLFSCSQCSFKTVSHESLEQHESDHKNGVITTTNSSTEGEGEVEVFPGNVAAAHLIYRCLNALSSDGSTLEANVTGSSTSADGTTQTITIQIPTQGVNNETEEDETTRCFLEIQQPEEEEGVDTGGITIPAEPEQSIVCHVTT